MLFVLAFSVYDHLVRSAKAVPDARQVSVMNTAMNAHTVLFIICFVSVMDLPP